LEIAEGFGFTAETQRSLRDAKFFEVKRNAEGSEVAEEDAEEEKRIGDCRLEIAEGFGFASKAEVAKGRKGKLEQLFFTPEAWRIYLFLQKIRSIRSIRGFFFCCEKFQFPVKRRV
jgi:hypothetical protein